MNQMNTNATESVLASGARPEAVPLSYPSMAPTPPRFGETPLAKAARSATSVRPVAPLPKRPKGRFFIGTLVLSVVGGFGFFFYDGWVRYAAYGEVVGRKIELAPPWEGVVSTLHVRVGDTLRQGDPVFNVESITMRHRMEQIEDSLNLQRARLGSELARLKWEAERVEDTQQLVKADYYEKWSELLLEESVLTDLIQQLARAEKLNRQNAIPVEQFESLKCRCAGQEQRVSQLAEAVHSLKRRVDTDRPIDPALNDQIKPSLVHIENLQSELSRVRQVLDQGLVTCPTNGCVTRILKYSGEYVDSTGAVVELLVDGSTEIILYLSQSASDQWSIGDQMDVRIEPANCNLDCEVVRLSPEMQRAPASIMRHYTTDDALFPVVVRPRDPKRIEHLVLGSKVRLPRVSLMSETREMLSWLGRSSEIAPVDMEPVREALTNRLKQQQFNSHRTASLR